MELIDNQWAEYTYPVVALFKNVDEAGSAVRRYFDSLEDYLSEMQKLICKTVGETDRLVIPIHEPPRFMRTAFGVGTRFAFVFEDTGESVIDATVTLLMPVPIQHTRH